MSVAARYTWWGVALGLCLLFGSILFLRLTGEYLQPYDLDGLADFTSQAHRDNPLLYIIDTSPFLIGLCARFAGARQDRIHRLMGDLEREVRDKTESLRQALVEAHREKHSVVYLAEHDALTGLLNRRRFLHETGRWLEHVQRYNYPVALVFLDLDHFKRVNDTHGHEAGDFFLLEVGAILQSTVRSTDCVSRIGGDEFVVLMPGSTGSQAAAATEKLLRTLSETTIGIQDAEYPASASIGLALAPDHAMHADDLIRCADAAMYAAKQAGRGCWRLYSPVMTVQKS
ncbi:MAG: GGDEF domain-containing protein [Pseudomonadota bacterium]